MHLGQACRKTKTNKWKSTSEVTLQDSNLEVYWQRGEKPGLVNMAETQGTPLSWGPRGGRDLGRDRRGVTSGDKDTPTPRLASSDIQFI